MVSILLYTAVSCEYGEIQLVGGYTKYEGRVEICINGQWGTVCDDDWGISDAQVVCSQLGTSFSSGTEFCHLFRYMSLIFCVILMQTGQALSNAYFGEGSGPIFLDNVACSGTESTLLSCNSSQIGSHFCEHKDDVGMRCSGMHYILENGACINKCKWKYTCTCREYTQATTMHLPAFVGILARLSYTLTYRRRSNNVSTKFCVKIRL